MCLAALITTLSLSLVHCGHPRTSIYPDYWITRMYCTYMCVSFRRRDRHPRHPVVRHGGRLQCARHGAARPLARGPVQLLRAPLQAQDRLATRWPTSARASCLCAPVLLFSALTSNASVLPFSSGLLASFTVCTDKYCVLLIVQVDCEWSWTWIRVFDCGSYCARWGVDCTPLRDGRARSA